MSPLEKLVKMKADLLLDRTGYSVGVGVGTEIPIFVRTGKTVGAVERAIEEAWVRWQAQRKKP